jgi:hypothetical protein
VSVRLLSIFGSWCSVFSKVKVSHAGIRVAKLAQNENFSRKIGTAAVRDHEITIRRVDAAEPS